MKLVVFFALGLIALRLLDWFIILTREPYDPVFRSHNIAVLCNGGDKQYEWN